jgi:hypothetical protein
MKKREMPDMKWMILCAAAAACAFAQGNGNTDCAPLEPPRDMEEVREGLAPVTLTVTEAYEELLRSHPDSSGEILVSFSIMPVGTVTDVEITCDPGLESLLEPVEAVVNELDFGRNASQTENIPVSLPYSLLPPNHGQEE